MNAIVIPLAVLVMVVLTAAMILGVRRRVKVHSSIQPDDVLAVAAIFGMIVLVDGAILGTAASLAAAGFPYPGTIGCAAGAAVLVIVGPLVNWYLGRLMLRQARQQLNHEKQAAGGTP